MKFKAKKFLGQVFLKDKKILSLIAKSLEIHSKETILEVGAGYGNLTEFILKEIKNKGKIIAIEKDKELIKVLREKFGEEKKLEIISGDIREIDLEKFLQEKKINKIVANLPYYLTGFFLRNLLDLKKYPSRVVLMLQKEVAEKILSPKSNFFSLSFSLVAKVKKIKIVNREKFSPKPKVDSLILKIDFLKKQKSFSFRQEFFSFLKKCFSHPRKTLLSNLKRYERKEKIEEIFQKLSLSKKNRPQELSLNDYLKIFSYFFSKKI